MPRMAVQRAGTQAPPAGPVRRPYRLRRISVVDRLDGTVALVTGASSGIGAATVRTRADGVTRRRAVAVEEVLIRPTQQAH